MPRVLLSHSSKDKPFVRALYERLTADEFNLTTVFQEPGELADARDLLRVALVAATTRSPQSSPEVNRA